MSEGAAFDALVEEFYPVWFRYHPDAALALGVPGYQGRLPAAGDDDQSALGGWLENLVVALGEIDAPALDPERRLDYRLLLESAQLEYQQMLLRDWRHLDPTRFLPVEEIYQLTLHPPEGLREVLLNLLRTVPAHLLQARGRLAELPQLVAPQMVRVAMEEAEAAVGYLRALVDSSWLRQRCHDCSEVVSACNEAIIAIHGYVDHLRADVAPKARGRLGCGGVQFRCLMERRHLVEIPLEGLRTYLEAAYRDTLRLLEEKARAMGIAPAPDQVFAHLQRGEVYSGERRLEVYREEAGRLRDFVRLHRFVTLSDQPFRIVERPACPRPGQCDNGYMQTADHSSGVFFISGWSAAESRDGEPRPLIRSHCISQGWLGAHLLHFSGDEEERSLPRRLAPAAAFGTAWDLYIRQFLLGVEYWDGEDRLVQLLYQLKALRLAMLDMDLNLGRIEGPRALERIAELEPDPTRALRQLVALARHPGDAMAGAVGWLLLHQTRELLQREEGFDPGEFHDRLLSQGPVPPALLIPHLFGEALWRGVQAELTI